MLTAAARAAVFSGPCTPGYNTWTEFIAEAEVKRRARRTTQPFDADWYLGRTLRGSQIVAVDPTARTLDLADGRVVPMTDAWRDLV